MSISSKYHFALFFICLSMIPVFVQLGGLAYNELQLSKLRQGDDIILAKVNRFGDLGGIGSKIKVYGAVGDIFRPDLRPFDAILVSALVEPVYREGRWFFQETNSLLTSLLRQIGSDEAAKPMITSILSRLQTLHDEPDRKGVCQARVEPDIAVREKLFKYARCFPFAADVPIGSNLREAGVHKLVVLPLFFSRSGTRSEEARKILADNVRQNVKQALEQLRSFPNVRGVAIPALAGTEFLLDSSNYLTYRVSFTQVIQGVIDGILSGQSIFDSVYLISWSGLKGSEASASTRGLTDILSFRQASILPTWGAAVTLALALATFLIRKRCPLKSEIKNTIITSWPPILVFIFAELIGIAALWTWAKPVGEYIWLFGGIPATLAYNLLIGILMSSIGYAIVQAKK